MRKPLPFPFLFSVFIVALCLAVAIVWRQNGYPTKGIDDANIFFSYAENFAQGNGFVYARNPVPVEGFTSLLWTLLCSACFAIHVDEGGVFVLTMLLLLGTQWICWTLLGSILKEKGVRSRIPFLLYAIGILSSTCYVTWTSITLMDVGLWGFFLAWFAWLFHSTCLRKEKLSVPQVLCGAVPFVLAPTVRPEFMAAIPALLGLLCLRNLFMKRPLRHIVVWGGVFFVSLGMLTAFRWHHFGYLLPNTFYAKVSPSLAYNLDMGIQYALPFITSGVFPILFCSAWTGWFVSSVCKLFRPRAEAHLIFEICASEMLLPWIAVLCILPILSGGDHFAYFRFYQPVYPLICLGLIIALPVSGWKVLRGKNCKTFASTSLLLLLPLGWHFSASYLQSHWQRLRITREFDIAESGIQRGTLFNALFADAPRFPNVGVIVAGGIARTYEGPLTDLMGLNDTVVAHFPGKRKGTKNHAAFELAAFSLLDVDVIDDVITGFVFSDKVLKKLFETSAFISEWRFGRIDNHRTGVSADLWIRQRFLDAVLATSDYEFHDLKHWTGSTWEMTTQAR